MKTRYKIFGGLLALVGVIFIGLALVISYTSSCETSVDQPDSGMQAVVARCYGSPDVLTLETLEQPVVGDNEVMVDVKAAAVNPLDYHYMRGSPYIMRLMAGIGKPSDVRVGVDFSGVVVEVGENVRDFAPGDRVVGARSGAFADFVVVPDDKAIVKLPESVSFVQAAALPIAAVTALQALRDKGQVSPGQRVLINGASGGVGTYAVQIAKSLGAHVTGVCSTRNIDMVRSLGADRVIDYKKASYVESNDTYDVIIDMVGNHSMSGNKNALVPNGKLVMVGGPKGHWIAPFKNSLKAMAMGPFIDQQFITLLAVMKKEDLATLVDLMDTGEVKSIVDRSFSLAQVPDAIRYSETGRARGKIIIDMQ